MIILNSNLVFQHTHNLMLSADAISLIYSINEVTNENIE